MKTKGITLLELLIVIIIITALTVTYVANYSGSSHVMQRGKAQNAIMLIVQGEKMVRSETAAWSTAVTPAELGLACGIDFTSVTSDTDWGYVIAAPIVTATRTAGTHALDTIIFDFATNTWSGTHP